MNGNDLDAFLKAESVEDIKAISDKAMNKGPYNGGPAFPTSTDGLGTGLNMRDWFAGMALQGMLTSGQPITDETTGKLYPKTPDLCSNIAYQYADAMLKEREKINTTSPGDDPV